MVGYLHYIDKSIIQQIKKKRIFRSESDLFQQNMDSLGVSIHVSMPWMVVPLCEKTVFCGGENTRMHKVELIYQ